MCGIAGKIFNNNQPADIQLILRMCALIQHRGPDDEGYYIDGPVGLGMRRLSIIDVTGGHQPIGNEDGTIQLIFNGEIYNFSALRQKLEASGHHFATHTDTEVVVHLYEESGVDFVSELNGMFAFALWDARSKKLVLGRDRLGKKPLHYAETEDGLVFASEIRPILEDPSIEKRVDLVALQQYLKLWYIPGPRTIFEGIYRLPPAHILVYQDQKIKLQRYWDVDFSGKIEQSEQAWMEQILALLEDAVRIRMISDVPLGALLSGGIDSSAVVSLMHRYSSQPIKTFSIGFEEEAYNELPFARKIAKHLGTDHHEEIVRPDASEVLPKLVLHYGEPFGDESCIPTYYVSRLARQHVTVALSGDGGDENFGGYPRVPQFTDFSGLNSIRGLVSGRIKNLFADRDRQASRTNFGDQQGFGSELAFRLEEIFNPMQRYANQWVVWKPDVNKFLSREISSQTSKREVFDPLLSPWNKTQGWDPIDRLMYLELMTYLPDDLQVKIDIASMACSLEVRAPFLDYRLIELTARMPSSLKFQEGQTKTFLRSVLRDLIPPEILNRNKSGFSMPVSDWLRQDLRPMMGDYLLGTSFQQQGYFSQPAVKQMVERHVAGECDYGRQLWLLLNFQVWFWAFIVGN
jgi:asparagine synthase (glutamine-hydrolysing)